MRIVKQASELQSLLDEAQSEADRAGNPAVFLEKFIPKAKHIEVQILADHMATSFICTNRLFRSTQTKKSSK